MVLSAAAFGKPMSWKTGFSASSTTQSELQLGDSKELADSLTSGKIAKEHKMTFTYALYMVSTHLLTSISLPSMGLMFTKRLREIRRSLHELEVT